MIWHHVRLATHCVEVCGPWLKGGKVHAMSAAQQREWAESIGGRLPTAAEFDAIWLAADVRVLPVPRDVMVASLTSLDDDVANAARVFPTSQIDPELLIACGKTWIDDGSGRTTNYGWHVPAEDVSGGMWRWIKVYPTSVDAYVIQPAGHAHSETHVDYSQAGYAVRDVDDPRRDETPPPPSSPAGAPPYITSEGDRGREVAAMQRWLDANGYPLDDDGKHGPLTQAALEEYLYDREEPTSDPIPDTDPAPLPMAPFRQARHYRKGRARGKPIWIVVHTAEIAAKGSSAEALQGYAASMADGRVASWHVAIDGDSIAPSVRPGDVAFAAPGANARGLQVELCTRAASATWDDDYHRRMLRLAARWCAAQCRAYGIPIAKVGPTEMRAGQPGLCGHVDVTRGVGSGRTTHRDPGPHFPWERFLAMVEAS